MLDYHEKSSNPDPAWKLLQILYKMVLHSVMAENHHYLPENFFIGLWWIFVPEQSQKYVFLKR
jgi:hypothetical protein